MEKIQQESKLKSISYLTTDIICSSNSCIFPSSATTVIVIKSKLNSHIGEDKRKLVDDLPEPLWETQTLQLDWEHFQDQALFSRQNMDPEAVCGLEPEK